MNRLLRDVARAVLSGDARVLLPALMFLAGLVAPVAAPAASPAAPADRPNILLLVSDDHSYPFLSCYGDTNVRTPNVDRLAAEGMKFHRFFTVAPQCVPSRAGYLTGRSAVAARMTRFSAALPRDEVTFLELLRQHAGYHTGICGRSFHLDGAIPKSPALDRIFEDNKLRTFADRVDFLNTCGDDEVAAQTAGFLDRRPADRRRRLGGAEKTRSVRQHPDRLLRRQWRRAAPRQRLALRPGLQRAFSGPLARCRQGRR